MSPEALAEFFSQLQHNLFQQLSHDATETRRVFHGRGRCFVGLEQLTADWLSGQLLITLFKEPEPEFLVLLMQGLVAMTEQDVWQVSGAQALLLQHRKRAGSPMEVVWGELNGRPVIQEQGLKYQLNLGRNQNHGLFLDMRLGRQWVREQARQKRVLNLFAYTCGFSVAALAGGAEKVVNIDMAKGMLNRGRENHLLNQQDVKKVTFLGHDIFRSWGKLRSLGPYELIIIDPPSFQKGSFAATTDYHKILRRLSDLLAKDGQVLACVNAPALPSQFLIDSMTEHAPQLTFVERLANPPEFADSEPEAGLKALVFRG
ncbi:class I SAM-dependent methyltransferase [Oceanisphaera avium]|uniref:Methyltransferase n=1 Tax=Oceanisphaera avium TaxID=1903694 RepID=A0A1Y0CWQ9_9GAMM|nr:class I SAM-dependent methyltransferase [Oceanisphaera avium]ART79327.1 methyltransferase [Oceanisphaera avium]